MVTCGNWFHCFLVLLVVLETIPFFHKRNMVARFRKQQSSPTTTADRSNGPSTTMRMGELFHSNRTKNTTSPLERSPSPQNENSPQFQNIEQHPSCFLPDTKTTMKIMDQLQGTLPKPVINLGLPKVGSTTLFDFFRCSGWKASHWSSLRSRQTGACMKEAHDNNQPLLQSCDAWFESKLYRDTPEPDEIDDHGTEAFLQMDFISKTGMCVFPQIQYLEEIHAESPNATFVLSFRPAEDWANSVVNWAPKKHGALGERFAKCDLPGLPPGKGNTTEELVDWWCWHIQNVRSFVAKYPSHNLVELDLYETEQNAQIMAILFGSNESCWGHSNANPKRKQNGGSF